MGTRLAAMIVMGVILLFARGAHATECTQDRAVQALGVLQTVHDDQGGYGFPELPDGAVVPGAEPGQWLDATGAGMAPATLIETWPRAALEHMNRDVVAVRHNLDAVSYSLEGRCGPPMSDAQQAQARQLILDFTPWLDAWTSALPSELARRAADKPSAAALCGLTAMRREAAARVAREERNPSGVVDLEELHEDGAIIQALDDYIAARKRLFVRDRGKPFTPALCS